MPNEKPSAEARDESLDQLSEPSDAFIEGLLGEPAETEEPPEAEAEDEEETEETPPETKGKQAEEERPEQEATQVEDELLESLEEPSETEEPPTEPTEGKGKEEPEAEAEREFEEFAYRAGRRDYSIPGSQVGEEGIFIPRDQEDRFRQLLSSAHGRRHQVQELAEQLEQEKLLREDGEKRIGGLIDALGKEIEAGGENVEALAEALKNRWPEIKAQAKVDAADAREELSKRRERAAESRRHQEEFEASVPSLVEQLTDHYAGLPQLADVPIARIRERIETVADKAISQAQQDGQLDDGRPYKAGTTLIDYDIIGRQLQDELRLQQSRTARVEQAKLKNKKRVKRSSKKAPPTVAAGGRPAPGREEVPVAKTREEADKLLDNVSKRLARSAR